MDDTLFLFIYDALLGGGLVVLYFYSYPYLSRLLWGSLLAYTSL